MKLAARLAGVAPSATLTLAQKAKEMKAAGRDVVSLTAGEPDFDAPAHIRDAMKASLDRGATRYTAVPGIVELREAIAEQYKAGGKEYGIDQIVVSCGAKQAVFNAAMALLEPGTQAVVIAPYWLSYGDISRVAGADVVTVATTEDAGFLVDPEALDQALGPKARLLYLNSPSNPTGAVYDRARLEQIAEVLRNHPNVVILADEIYERFLYDGETFVSLLDVAPDLKDRTLLLGGISKTYAMTGIRVGWALGPKPLIAAMSKLQGQSTSNASAPAQWAALAAITQDQSPVTTMVEAFDARRKHVVEGLRKLPGTTCFSPKGAFYAFPSIRGLVGKSLPGGAEITDATPVCTHLLQEHAVVVVPGAPFGAPNHFRISYATDLDTLNKGLERMHTAFSAIMGA